MATFNAWGESVASQMTKIFSPQARSASETNGSAAAGTSSSFKRSTPPVPFDEVQAAWLGEALQETWRVFGERVEGRIAQVEQKALAASASAERAEHHARKARQAVAGLETQVRQSVAGSSEAVAGVKGVTSDLAALAEGVASIERAMSDASSTHRGSGSPGWPGSSSSSGVGDVTPVHLRTLARLGGLGWDVTADEICTRAKKLLQAAGVPSTAFSTLAPAVNRQGVGSGVDVPFISSQELQAARLRLRAASIIVAAGKPAWLNAALEPAEISALRGMHRAAEFLEAVAATRGGQAAAITKESRSRAVLRANGRVLVVGLGGRVLWTPRGLADYGDEDRRQVEAAVAAA